MFSVDAQINSKANTVAQGTVSLATPSMESSFDVVFDAARAQAASPKARIVIYYFTSTGEIVADSIEFQVDALFQNQVPAPVSHLPVACYAVTSDLCC